MNAPGITAKHFVVSELCRQNRGIEGALEEVLGQLRIEYLSLQLPVNQSAKFHFVLTVERSQEPEIQTADAC